jgi:hypothetical protein
MRLALKEHEGVLRPLILVLKSMLRDRSLHDTSSGGLSSSGLFMLLYCFLNGRKPPPTSATKPSIGELLLQFLEMFGNLDYSKWIITTEGLKPRSLSDLSNGRGSENEEGLSSAADMSPQRSADGGPDDDGSTQAIIVDPCDRRHNIAQPMYRLTPLKTTLLQMLTTLVDYSGDLTRCMDTNPRNEDLCPNAIALFEASSSAGRSIGGSTEALFVTGWTVDNPLTRDDIIEHFSQYCQVQDVTMKVGRKVPPPKRGFSHEAEPPKPYCFVRVFSRDLDRVHHSVKLTFCRGHQIKVHLCSNNKREHPSNILNMSKLPSGMRKSQQLFSIQLK